MIKEITYIVFEECDSVAMAKCQVDYFKRQGIKAINEGNIVYIDELKGLEKGLL